MNWISFKLLPASWGLVGDAYDEAKAHYELKGEELARRLAVIRHRDDPTTLVKKQLDIDLQYKRIAPYDHAWQLAALDYSGDELTLHRMALDVEYGKTTAYDAAIKQVDLRHAPGMDHDLALLDVELEFNRLSKSEYHKARATLRSEPWIAIVNSGFDPEQGIDGVFFEFDWNKPWIEFLRLNGYIGHTDEQIVDEWFTDVCRSYGNAELASVPFPKDFGIS